jgi:hypothetical protein
MVPGVDAGAGAREVLGLGFGGRASAKLAHKRAE